MNRLIDVTLSVIFISYLVVLGGTNYTTTGYGEQFVGDDATEDNVVSTEVAPAESEDRTNFSLVLKMATLCETPNHDPGFCIEVRLCPVLLKQLNNTKARQFLRESVCGPANQNRLNPKVCCGKYDNHRNVSKNIVDDDSVFPKSCGAQRIILRGRIVGGKEAVLGEYPWMARLTHKNKYGYKTFGCSGFLIHTKYVLTAGHCTHPDMIKVRGPVYSVVLGEHDTETAIDCSTGGLYCAEPRQISRAEKVIVHPEYNPNSNAHYNDIALIHLKKGIRMTDYIKPICLLKDSTEIPSSYYLSGWGKTEKSASSTVKMKVEVPSFDKMECKEKYSLLGIDLRDTQICAGGENLKDSCSGDSGGPLMLARSNGTYYASGIVSYGIGCGIKNWPGVYTSIPDYIPWIKREILVNSLVSTKSKKIKNRRNKKTKQKEKKKVNVKGVP